MKAHLFRDPRTLMHSLFVFDSMRSGERVYFTNNNGELVKTVAPEGGPMEPLIVLDSDAWRAVCAELFDNGFAPVDPETSATKSHLSDAIAIRDRLLTMIEKSNGR